MPARMLLSFALFAGLAGCAQGPLGFACIWAEPCKGSDCNGSVQCSDNVECSDAAGDPAMAGRRMLKQVSTSCAEATAVIQQYRLKGGRACESSDGCAPRQYCETLGSAEGFCSDGCTRQEDCGADADCVPYEPYGEEGTCVRTCAGDADCGEGLSCQTRRRVTHPNDRRFQVREQALCLPAGDRTPRGGSIACQADRECPDEMACFRHPDSLEPGMCGRTCPDGVCDAFSLCVQYTERPEITTCALPCADASDCASGLACIGLDDGSGSICFPVLSYNPNRG